MIAAQPTSTSRLALALAIALALAGTGTCAGAAPFVLAYADSQLTQSYTNLQAYHARLSAVGIGSAYALLSSGSVDSGGITATTRNIIAFAKGKGLPLYPTVSDYSNSYGGFDPAVSTGFLASAASRANTISNLVVLVTANGFAGIDLDLEAVRPSMKAQMSAFTQDLASALHKQGRKLIVSIAPKSGDSAPSYLAGYDYAALGAAADYFQLMTYDETGPGWSSSPSATWPGPETGLDWMKSTLAYALSRVPASKVLQGLPTYGYDYSTGKTVYWKAANGVSGYDDVIRAHGATVQFDTASATPYATWGSVKQQRDGVAWSKTTKQPVLWYDDTRSIAAKAALVGSYGLGGTSVWAMGYEDAAFWSALAAGLDAGGAGSGGGSGGGSGSDSGNIAPSGIGYAWSANASASADGNRVAAPAVNDANLASTLVLNGNGEGGSQKWQAAGVLFSSPRTISSAALLNGALDSYGNGYFESGVSLQYSTDRSTWQESGWSATPAYPNGPAAADASFTFGGAPISGVLGVRVSGRTGASSWSGAVKEIQVRGE